LTDLRATSETRETVATADLAAQTVLAAMVVMVDQSTPITATAETAGTEVPADRMHQAEMAARVDPVAPQAVPTVLPAMTVPTDEQPKAPDRSTPDSPSDGISGEDRLRMNGSYESSYAAVDSNISASKARSPH
jgi:hypothetical protein